MNADGPSIRLLTLTRFWQFDKYLHNVGDRALWVPVRHRTIVWTAAVFAPIWLLLSLVNLGWSGPGLTGHFVVPGLLVWWIVAQVEKGVRPVDVGTAWLRHAWAAAHRPRTGPVRIRSAARKA